MGRLGRGDDHGLHLGVGHQVLPVGRGAGKAIGAAVTFGVARGLGGNHLQPGAQGRVEHRAHHGQRRSMGLAHVPTADQPDPKRACGGHVALPFLLQPVANRLITRPGGMQVAA